MEKLLLKKNDLEKFYNLKQLFCYRQKKNLFGQLDAKVSSYVSWSLVGYR